MTCSPEFIDPEGESWALYGVRNARGDPGRAAAGEHHATGAAGVSAGVTGSENISSGRKHVTVSAGEVQVIHDR
jgi:hypothetical protein